MKRIALYFTIFAFLGCSKVPITGRKQTQLLPESQMMGMANGAYADFLTANTVVPVTTDKDAQMVQRLGKRMSGAIEKFLKETGHSKRIKGFEWEFNLVNDPNINAWCMPGGKIVVYSGILPVTQDEEGLAVVMGHEIAHAIARHGNERMSQQLLITGGGLALGAAMDQKPEQTRNIFLQAYGIGSTLGALSYSRKNESEADHMGLVFMAVAGYNPETAVDFWTRMSQAGGGSMPEFLSTHPSDETRIKDIEDKLMEAKRYFKPYTGS